MSRTFEALKRAEQERSATLAARAARSRAPAPEAEETPVASPWRWRIGRRARAAEDAERRAEAAALHAALSARLEAVERRLGMLDETLAKQLAELEPKLLHVLELRTQGFERALASLARDAEALSARGPWPAQASLAPLAGLALVAFGLGLLLGPRCAG